MLPSEKIELLGLAHDVYEDEHGRICAAAALVTLPEGKDYNDYPSDDVIAEGKATYGEDKVNALIQHARDWCAAHGRLLYGDDAVTVIAVWNDAVGQDEVIRVLKALDL